MMLCKAVDDDGTMLTIYAVHPSSVASPMSLGTLVCWHRKYKIGAEHEWDNPEAFAESRRPELEDTIILPVFMFDHGGVTLSTIPFSCPWDSGQVGWVYTTHKTMEDEEIHDYQAAVDTLRKEVELYSKYFNGEIYEYEIEEEGSPKGPFIGRDELRDSIPPQYNHLWEMVEGAL